MKVIRLQQSDVAGSIAAGRLFSLLLEIHPFFFADLAGSHTTPDNSLQGPFKPTNLALRHLNKRSLLFA
jgi:hypothetical protein